MDAMYFREPSFQFNIKHIERDLMKAFTSFYPQETKDKGKCLFGIITGNWGCGAFNGDRQVKGNI